MKSSDSMRMAEINRAGHACERCGWLAWSNERCAQLRLRPRLDRTTGKIIGLWVLCPTCTEKHDAKHDPAPHGNPNPRRNPAPKTPAA